MEDHLNSNLDPSVPLSVYQVRESSQWSAVRPQPLQELYQELETHRGLSRANTGLRSGSRKTYPSIDITRYGWHCNTVSLVSPLLSLSSMGVGVDLETGPVSTLDNKLAEDSNKVSESIAEKTAKLHRLLGDSDKEKGFHLG